MVFNSTYFAYIRSGKDKDEFEDWLKEKLAEKADK
jgi:hypothetical protein